ncbi:FUSC family protein [Kribbella sp. NPDC051952]|uniref:FUSC family protein n=1 Tax=Kribbella sp. NPDC051952 TaxID=3154851 RepID=UPI003419DA00
MTVLAPRDILRWSPDPPVGRAAIITAALAMAPPVAYGVLSGHLVHASYAALGAMATALPSGLSAGGWRHFSSFGGRAVRLGVVGMVVTAAAFAGAWLGGRGWVTAIGVVVLAAVAGVVGGFSRWTADVTTRFVTFLVIATGVGAAADPAEVALWFAIGAAWAVVVALPFLSAQSRAAGPSYEALRRRWLRNLRRADGWRYPAQLLPCLALAEVIGVLWHQDKAYWIAVAVVIVLRRGGGSLLRATQRCLGTCIGVLIGAAVILWVPPSWVIVAIVALLAGARPLLKVRNYAAYATVMTPLLVLLLDLGRTPALSTVGYRLIDTVFGCSIALIPSVVRRIHVG